MPRVAPHQKSTSSTHPVAAQEGLRNRVLFDRALARDGAVDPTDKAVYVALATFADPATGKTPYTPASIGASVLSEDVPTRKRLAECIGKTVFTVDRSIKRLEALGVVRVHRHTHPDNPKVHLPSVYELLPYRPQAVPAPQPVAVPAPRKRLPISATKRARILARDAYCCKKCGATDDLTIDHIQHWSRGGTNADDNLRVLCRSCNSQRNDGSLEGLDS